MILCSAAQQKPGDRKRERKCLDLFAKQTSEECKMVNEQANMKILQEKKTAFKCYW